MTAHCNQIDPSFAREYPIDKELNKNQSLG